MKLRFGALVGVGVAVMALPARPASAQTPLGAEFRVNAYTTGDQLHPRVAMDPSGGVTVVWQSPQDGSGTGIYAQRYASTGSAVGGEFRVNVYTTTDQRNPDVAVSQGGAVITWQNYTPDDVKAARVFPSGTLGPEFLVNVYTTNVQNDPSVAAGPNGDFVIAWHSAVGATGPGTTSARLFSPTGVGGDDLVAAVQSGANFAGPSVAWLQQGLPSNQAGFVVVWHAQDGSSQLKAREFDSGGTSNPPWLGAPFTIALPGGFGVTYESVSADSVGNIVASGVGGGIGPFVVGYPPPNSPNPATPTFVPSSLGSGDRARVAVAPTGDFVAVWEHTNAGAYKDINAQMFSATGNSIGAAFLVNTFTTGDQTNPAVAYNGQEFVVVWESAAQDGGGTGVFGRRFGGVIPTALAVDVAGNGVLEPNESNVSFKPSWRNLTGGVVSPVGTLTNFTGPAGPTYTIADASGSYSLSAGATAQCSDCYALTLGSASRPATHWDASVTETLTDASTTAIKTWQVHVGNSFGDVGSTAGLYTSVEKLEHRVGDASCGSSLFCPTSSITREVMAKWLLESKEGSSYVPPDCATAPFNDVSTGHPYCRWIQDLKARGITTGCGSNNYCPTASVTRASMAPLLLKTLNPALSPTVCLGRFVDVPDGTECPWIELLTSGPNPIATPCSINPEKYCPSQPVQRDQMAAFLVATFGLTLYGP